ncbi:SAM-dependent methyltransferase [Halarsenatibacter silvermanii]|uniref:Cyclopropane-fatty-acyl-phospholipid synthase n=1 Tax=Halarsenatibacter silvermanii TaxID=321763 RepID=A0A1G9TVP9_9FIRM|nr:cyclopropane-fatty-acyl-phospholipid synthase family protein [Halarsenatibacter silvermanii]SDM51806.1 cyclopropane-fatty-acyl-phospholipid synthase [Halarsenatibacter silvermanii]
MLQKQLVKKFAERVEGSSFKLTFWDGDSTFINNGEVKKPEFEIIFREKLDLNEIRKSPQLKLGEAYMQEKIDIDGDLRDVIITGAKNVNNLAEGGPEYTYEEFMDRQKRLSQQEQEEGVRDHYDLGNDFFRLWQDETMTYSCAYFENHNKSLKQAQLAKIDHILEKLNLESGEKLLDIGCGWGHLAVRAAKKYDVEVLGITLSPEQVDGAEKKIAENNVEDQVEVRKQDYRDLAKESPEFDKIVSVGMFEHVGKEHIPEYFQAVNEMLKEGGLSLLHTITHQKEDPSHPWLEKYIFPWGYIPSYREVVWQLPEHSFWLIDAENIRRHYALTAERWADNFADCREEVVEMFDEEFARMWELFLAGVVATFRYIGTSVHQFLFSKGINNDLPLTRDYMYDK